MKQINWYPGHMAKAKRLLTEQLKRVDLVIELCDARLPYSSRNPDLDQLAEKKARILLLNKADLAAPNLTDAWMHHFRSKGLRAEAVCCEKLKASDAIQWIQKETEESVQRAADRGIRKTVRAMVVGVPNVGKSTFINRLHGGSIARTGDRPGVTKNNQWIRIHSFLELMDTPGLLWPRLEDQTAARRLCYLGTVRDEVIDQEELAISLLDDLANEYPQSLQERFRLKDLSLRGVSLLEAVCRERGFLLRGGEFDYSRGCAVILDEFRGGKMGRITLEKPDSK